MYNYWKRRFKMKKILILLVGIILLLTSLSSCSSSKKIKIGVEGAYPPFSQIESDGSLTGFDIDFANAICEEMQAECELVVQDWDGMIPALLAKKFDAIVASMSITKERKQKVNFTKKYYSSPANFIAPVNGAKLSDTKDLSVTASELKGLKVGVQQSTISDNFLTDNFSDIADIKRYDTQENANLDLIAGRLDLVFADTFVLVEFLDSNEVGDNFQPTGTYYDDPRWFGDGIGIAIRKEDTDLLSQFNDAIDALRENGIYQEINDIYFSFDIYGE